LDLPHEPNRDCRLCPRLADFRLDYRKREPEWHNAPVPTFGSPDARLLIVGLAPGLRGANRTGRPFTGDFAGDLLYETLIDFDFATGQYDKRPDDSLQLTDAAITNAVRCVPPQNKPIGAEMRSCRPFLAATIDRFDNLKAILALGRIAHENVLSALERRRAEFKFGHCARHSLGKVNLYDSYHCSRYNTNTGRLTTPMFRDVFAMIRKDLS